MTTRKPSSNSPDPFCTYILVTGANAGLGLAICLRLIDDFLSTRPESQSLHLVISTRSAAKSAATLRALEAHVWASSAQQRDADFRTTFQAVELELTSLASVRAAADSLRASLPRLDVLVCNAGIAGWIGIDWGRAVLATLVDLVESVTFPNYMLASVGSVTQQQVLEAPDKAVEKVQAGGMAAADATGATDAADATGAADATNATASKGKAEREPPLGEVFAANVFGHYMLIHQLAPLLYPQTKPAGLPRSARIVWLSSIEAHARCFDIADPQSLRSPHAYQSSKRLTDILALSSTLTAPRPLVSRLLSPHSSSPSPATPAASAADPPAAAPSMHLTHPGIVSSNIMPLHPVLAFLKLIGFYLARLLGSPWHVITPRAGARAVVHVALASQSTLDAADAAVGGHSKWGSAMDWRGRERLLRTEVEGWGLAGKADEEERDGSGDGAAAAAAVAWRRKGVAATTAEEKEAFERLGSELWQYMEALRLDWEARMGWIDG